MAFEILGSPRSWRGVLGLRAWRVFAVLVVLAALTAPGEQQQGRGHKRDAGEIARQNRITEQILAQFLQRRLFPQEGLLQTRQQGSSYLRRPWPVAAPAVGLWEWDGGGRGGVRGGGGGVVGGKRGGTKQGEASSEDSAWEEEYYDNVEEEGKVDEEEEEVGEGGEEDEGGGGKKDWEDKGKTDQDWSAEEDGVGRDRDEEDEGRKGSFNRLGDGLGFIRVRGRGKVGEESLETEETENISSEVIAQDCANCVDDSGFGNSLGSSALNRWTMPLFKLGEKRYYLGIFFKANWYRAAQFCRYHGMHLASIESQEESDKLEKHIRDYGLGHEHFWTSGTDQGEEGVFFWLSTGRPVTYTNWNAGEPNNFRYENGEEEHCLELWNRDGKGLKWNDTPCSFETFFVCEVQ